MPSSSGTRLAILLGTFQGERFLARQLESIERQTHGDWALWASDDGSRDATAAILQSYRKKWGAHRLHVATGSARGFSANFLGLACDTGIHADYFAFCDQDDVWDPDKTATAISWLSSVPDHVPALYCGRTRLIDEEDREIGLSPLFERTPGFPNAIVQSIAGGNTMVFNKAARALLVEAGADVDVQTHDWWAYILVTACGGRVSYDAVPKTGYRQHGGNLVGSNASWRGRLQRMSWMLEGRFRAMNDRNIAALQRVRHRVTPENLFVLEEFTRARDRWLLPRMVGIGRSGVYRQTPLSNRALVLAAVLGKL